MRTVLLAGMVALLFAAPARAQSGPALSVPEAELAPALACPKPLAGAPRAPVLLIPGTNLEPQPNFDWNYQPALDAAGISWCTVTLPRFGMHDVQIAAEYVVYALRKMSAQAGRRVSIIGFSQGGMIGRWALRWWPDTRSTVEDLIGLAPSNHGTLSARAACASSCAPSYWQQRDDSQFIAALNEGPETFAGIDYTVAYTHNDEVVTPNGDEQTGSSPLRTGDGRIRNVAIQDICPGDFSEHLALGSYDPVGWALAHDALTHDGPADPARIDPATCSQPFMPGVDPAAFPANYLRYAATLGQGAEQADQVDEEPPLRCYVTQTCSGTTTKPATKPKKKCTSRRRFTIRLGRRLRRARVTAGKQRFKTRRRNGRLVATLDFRGRAGGTVKVRIRGTTRAGRRISKTRRYRLCARR